MENNSDFQKTVGEQLQREMQGLGLRLYQKTIDEDLALAAWWSETMNNGEIEDLFAPTVRPLGAFMAHFRGNASLVYAVDPYGKIYLAVWFEQAFECGAFINVWVREDERASRNSFRALQIIYTFAMRMWKTLLGMTREDLLDMHKKLGYVVQGRLPELTTDNKQYWLVYLTQEAFKDSKLNIEKEFAL